MKKPKKALAAKKAARVEKRKKVRPPRELSGEEIGNKKRKKLRQPKPVAKESDIDVKEQSFSAVDARALVYSRRVDKIDKDLGLSTSLNKQPRMSTGLLAFDQLLGSGYVPGFNVVFGAEASAKSTACMTTLGSSIRMPIPVRKYFDAEGAIDRRYTGNILRSDSFDDIFGSRSRTGEWIKPPLCRYHDTNIIQEVFRDVHRIAKFMPDKVFRPEVGENGEWFLVFDRTKEQVALLKELKLTPSKSLYQKTAKYWCSVGDDDSPQAAVFIDSLPSLIPQEIDEESMSDKARAIEARYLSQYMKLVRGDLRPKAIVLLAVNQLRSNPNPQPGSMDWYEPGGNAIKFASDTRTMFTSRVPLDNFPRFKDNKGLCEEPSLEFPGGTDLYAFKGMTNYKNKYGTPGRKSAGRVLIKDGSGAARGFDTVYDTFKFLDNCGVIQGPIHDSRRRFRIDLKPVRDVEWSWPMFKACILANDGGNRAVRAKAQELGAPKFDLRKFCKKLVETGRSEELMIKAAVASRQKAAEIDLEADDDGEE
jgi:RecA/RadA recombinase